MKKTLFAVILTGFLAAFLTMPVLAADWEKYDHPVPTKVVVRVLAHGAKSMNRHTGAMVIIRDAVGGGELAGGPVEGETGDDYALMRAGYPRILGKYGLVKGDKGMMFQDLKADEKASKKGWFQPDPYFDIRDARTPDELKPVIYESPIEAAKFETTLNISKPTQIVIEVDGPLMPRHATATSVTSAWVFPGEDIIGEGIVVELRGVIVDAQDSLRGKEIKADDVKDGMEVPFFMRMMCGCPITVGGKFGIPWEAEGFKITTQAYYKGKLYHEEVTTADKLYADVSQFKTKIPLPSDLPKGPFQKERVKIRIMSAQAELANYGIDEFDIYLSR